MTAPCASPGGISNIRIIGADDGPVYHIHGDQSGDEGVELVEGGLEDLYEAEVRVIERTPVRMDGGVLRGVKTAIMEPVITLLVRGDHVSPFGQVDGELREAFSHELDPYDEQSTLARIEWETKDSTRWLEVVLTPGSKHESKLVPQERGWWEWEVHLKAYTPFWMQDDDIVPLEFTEDGTKQIMVDNPTGVDMAHKWVGTQAQWTLPDNTWTGRRWERQPGGRFPDRTITYPNLTPAHGGIRIDHGDSELQVRDGYDHNLAGQMPVQGEAPRFLIPRFCQPVLIDVTAENVPPEGAMIQLRKPRRFRKPWGRV